ncbi:hypothetical protein ACWDG9_30845 [Streptomyces sp. NPDC001073]
MAVVLSEHRSHPARTEGMRMTAFLDHLQEATSAHDIEALVA